MANTGDTYKFKKPRFVQSIGQGESPAHYTIVYKGVPINFEWNTTIIVDEGISESVSNIGGKMYVKPELVNLLKQFKVIKNG